MNTKIDLKKYLTERDSKKETFFISDKPVITISREFGCAAREIAKKLVLKLNSEFEQKGQKSKWKWINKEILAESARELKVDVKRIQHIFESEERGLFGELIQAHSERYYTSDHRIKQAIAKVVRSFINEGHVIIVGRGAVSIAKDHPKSLHVMLQAPFDWRVEQVSEKRDLPVQKVIPYAREIDIRRKKFRDFFLVGESDHTLFDVIFNRMTMDDTDIVDAIICIMKNNNMLEG